MYRGEYIKGLEERETEKKVGRRDEKKGREKSSRGTTPKETKEAQIGKKSRKKMKLKIENSDG